MTRESSERMKMGFFWLSDRFSAAMLSKSMKSFDTTVKSHSVPPRSSITRR